MTTKKSYKKKLLQASVSLALVVLLLQFIDLRSVFFMLKDAHLFWFFVGVVIVFADQVFMGLKWNLLLKALGVSVSAYVPIIAYLRGRAFKYIVPSTLGVDAYKTFYLKRYHESTGEIVTSIVIERFFGIISSLMLVALLLYFFVKPLQLPIDNFLLPLSLALCLSSLLCLYLLIRNIEPFARWPMWGKLPHKLKEFITPLFENLTVIHSRPKTIYQYVALSVVEKLFFGFTIYCCALSLGMAESSLFYIVAATPVLALLERIPISVSAIGLREGLFVAMFSPLGVPPSEAIAVALMLRAIEIA
ncbi:MAG: lysylphosphatidylglycerol synthase transmembrane domain-containing protein, partial [Pseudomonadales bacterium]